MGRKKKRKFSFFRFILLICILGFVYSYYSDEIKGFIDSVFEDKIITLIKKKNTNKDIVNTKETDEEVIDYFFANGMSERDYTKILEKKDNYLKNTHDYEELSYNFEKKLHYSEIVSYLNKLNYSDIVNLELIGYSVDNREIYSIEIGNGNETIMIDSNIHAAEVGNTPILIAFLTDLVNKYEDNDEEAVEMLKTHKLVVLPCINPDGYEVYNYGIESLNNKNLWLYKNRKSINIENYKGNANGVDINRNLPSENAGLLYSNKKLRNNVSRELTTKEFVYYGGSVLGSEPETKALMYFMLKHYKNASKYINMHSQGRVIYSGKPNLSDEFNNLCTKEANRIEKINDYEVLPLSSEEIGEGNDGTATDFMSELANGFVFSSKTGRLSSSSYMNNNATLKYNYSVLTIETLDDYTRSTTAFYKEYYNYKLKNVLYSLIK